MEKNLKSFTKSPWKARVPNQESARKPIQKIQNYFLETLVANGELKMASWSSENGEFQPHFLAQNLTKILILKGLNRKSLIPWEMVIFITIVVRNFMMLTRWKTYTTPESILNSVQC